MREIPVLRDILGTSCELGILAGFAAVFVVALVLVSLFTPLLAGAVQNSAIGPVDQGLGFLFGIARGVLLVVIALVVYNTRLRRRRRRRRRSTTAAAPPIFAGLEARIQADAARGRPAVDRRPVRPADAKLRPQHRPGADDIARGRLYIARATLPPRRPMPCQPPFDDDKLHEECGVFGVIGVQDAATFVALGLHALQHRGQEAGGIVAYAPEPGFTSARRFGYVRDNFTSASADGDPAGRRSPSATSATRPPAPRAPPRSATSSRSSPSSPWAAPPSPTTATSPTPSRCARS